MTINLIIKIRIIFRQKRSIIFSLDRNKYPCFLEECLSFSRLLSHLTREENLQAPQGRTTKSLGYPACKLYIHRHRISPGPGIKIEYSCQQVSKIVMTKSYLTSLSHTKSDKQYITRSKWGRPHKDIRWMTRVTITIWNLQIFTVLVVIEVGDIWWT